MNPQWLEDWRASVQRTADAKYSDALLQYERQRTEWVENNIRNREMGLSLTPIPVPPKHTIVSIEGLSLKQEETLDPNLKPPVLPPPAKGTSTPISTQAPATTDAMLAMLTGCLQMLSELKADVAAIKAKLGIV